ncbi:phi PVL orf 39-like protein [Staphylococcus simiae CCM 7213 = CCUG 51256]|uniref:Phi PVL orf 39-like protein n=1 Tax=Staphylococcus simiae CCM 7213 = CCUG 51256 TaxID=911238 RepID=G5JJV7_9STAP|nr:phi PVL orf 39-like protein [Staphylococcus simiae CCM 7213 = CCUG 51256]SNV75468.1 putative phi PVL-like protein [Staphylococcus simiae]
MAVKKQDYGVLISVLDLEGRYIAGMNIEEESDIYIATDNLQQAMREWIEENTDERDRLMNLVMKW